MELGGWGTQFAGVVSRAAQSQLRILATAVY